MNKIPYSNIKSLTSRFNELYGSVTDEQVVRYESTFLRFKNAFNETNAFVASSSGRVEVCGNHTDHNGGVVISCAISLDTLAMFLPTDDNVIRIFSDDYPEIVVKTDFDDTIKSGTSAALVKGVVEGYKNRGYNVGGFKAVFTSNVLGGAGISSSASFELLIAEILNFLYNDDKIDCQTKAIVSQCAENVYFGKPCGLLDQTAISFGGLKKLDFSDKNSIGVKDIPCSTGDFEFVLINTGGSHADLTNEYAAVPAEMFNVAKRFGKERLVDVGKDEFYKKLPEVLNDLTDREVLRAIHFFEENDRVDILEKAISDNDLQKIFETISASGKSSLYKLQNCYVAGKTDQAIPKAIALAEQFNNFGATRVHGGGFAGCILNVIKSDKVDEFIDKMSKFYDKKDIIRLYIRSVGSIVL